jgi:hypothetical protein
LGGILRTRKLFFGDNYTLTADQANQAIESLTATPITFEQYDRIVTKMHRLEDQYDTETAHVKADKLISSFVRELGYDELADAFDDIEK